MRILEGGPLYFLWNLEKHGGNVCDSRVSIGKHGFEAGIVLDFVNGYHYLSTWLKLHSR